MPVSIKDIYRLIDGFAPFALAEEWDNAGLLAGEEDAAAERILCALELNPAVLREAVECGAQLIVTHHPILFRARRNLTEDDAEGRLLCALVRSGIALIAAHTNFDNADPGVNDALADCLGLKQLAARENGMRIGETEACTLASFAKHAETRLGGPVRIYGEADRPVRRIALLGGAGGDFAEDARKAGADVYLTGEISHHRAWDAYLNGLCILEAGHAATELPGVKLLTARLQNAANVVKYKVSIFESQSRLFR